MAFDFLLAVHLLWKTGFKACDSLSVHCLQAALDSCLGTTAILSHLEGNFCEAGGRELGPELAEGNQGLQEKQRLHQATATSGEDFPPHPTPPPTL